MKKYILFALSGLLMTSCLDTEVLPYNVTVGEDMWQMRADVQSMVIGAYQAMESHDAVARMIVWGDFRSDDVTINTNQNITGDANEVYRYLKEMHSGIMDDHNYFADWASLYTVINRCNQVLEKAPAVISIDPSYTEATYNTDKSQMLALKALAYFYLVRTFRDVPYPTEAYFDSSQETDVPQSTPGDILDRCIADLQEAAATPLSASGYGDWRKVGLINKDGIHAILADIYLWRASMTHSAEDFQKCIEYCDLVIESKKATADTGPNSNLMESDYPLIMGADAYKEIFSEGNSSESILELQMQASTYNTGLLELYYKYDGTKSSSIGYGYFKAPIMFSTAMGITAIDGATSPGVFKSTNDYRMYRSVFKSDNADFSDICKIVYNEGDYVSSNSLEFVDRPNSNDVGYTAFSRNWIIYRLTDIMLMKAEALVALSESDTDTKLTEAFELVKAVNDRSLSVATDELTQPTTLSEMEFLVLAERQRELCFEGKRWFDLMRFNYRHSEAADIYKLMSETNGSEIHSDMLSLMVRRYVEGGSSVRGRYSAKKEFMLYFPVYYDELKSNYGLVQNPAYN